MNAPLEPGLSSVPMNSTGGFGKFTIVSVITQPTEVRRRATPRDKGKRLLFQSEQKSSGQKKEITKL